MPFTQTKLILRLPVKRRGAKGALMVTALLPAHQYLLNNTTLPRHRIPLT